MKNTTQKSKTKEEHFVKTYAHLHRYLPDRGYYVTVDNCSDPKTRRHISINCKIDHLSDPKPSSKPVFMKAFRSAIDKMSGKTEDDMMEINEVDATTFDCHVRRDGVDIIFKAKYIRDGYFEITIIGLVTTTGDSIYGFLYSIGLLDFLKSEMVNICREHIHVSKDEIDKDEAKAAKEQLNMIRDSYML